MRRGNPARQCVFPLNCWIYLFFIARYEAFSGTEALIYVEQKNVRKIKLPDTKGIWRSGSSGVYLLLISVSQIKIQDVLQYILLHLKLACAFVPLNRGDELSLDDLLRNQSHT